MRLQDLEAVSAHLCLRIERICRNQLKIAAGSRLLLAVSGGADSLALAVIFQALAPRLDASVSAIHINHNLRAAAAEDAAFVEKFCTQIGMLCAVVDINVNDAARMWRCGLEEAGRILRYRVLEERRKIQKADQILTGHHAGDLAEDILMRVMRGAGWPALGGMAWKNGKISRPLLRTQPQELRALLLACGFSWREDESNQSLEFLRNRLRHVVLPLLRLENPAINQSMGRIHELAQLDRDYWDNLLDSALQAHPWQISRTGLDATLLLPRKLLEPLHPAARMRLYHRGLNQLRDSGQNRMDALLRLERAWQSGIGGRAIQCSGGITAYCAKNGITFNKKRAATSREP